MVFWEAVGISVALWFAIGWYQNERLKLVHTKIDIVLNELNGLKEYLYEIDPQFDDERELLSEFYQSMESDKLNFTGKFHMDLVEKKKLEGRRTLNSQFYEGGFRAPNN